MLCLINLSTYAQKTQGKAYYQTKTTFEMNDDNNQISIERQKMFKKMMRKQFEKVYELSFNNTESIYKVEEELQQPGKRRMRMFRGFGGGKYYKNTQSKVFFVKAQNLMGKEFLIKDSLKVLKWTFEDESRMIGKHFCLKATAIKEVSGEQFRFGPPKRNNLKEKPKKSIRTIKITAWYTPEMPVNHGSGDYWGFLG